MPPSEFAHRSRDTPRVGYDPKHWLASGAFSPRSKSSAPAISGRLPGTVPRRHSSAAVVAVPDDFDTQPNQPEHRAVGNPPVAPHGVPLSTGIRLGRPQRANALRRASWTGLAPTSAQKPRGENHGFQHRAATLINQPQPRGLTVLQGKVFAGVDLPDVVRCCGAARISAGWTTGGCRGQARLAEPALDGPGRGDAVPHAAQIDAKVFSTPFGMSAARRSRAAQ